MTSHVKTPALAGLLRGDFDFDAGGDDWRVLLAMTNTTLDTEEDLEFVGDATTLDEMDGANYVRKAAASEAVTADLTNDRGEFDLADITWTALGAGTRQVAGALLFKQVTNDADSPAFAWIDSGGFPFAANGGDFTIEIDPEGVVQTANAA